MKIQNYLVKSKNYKKELLKKGFGHIDCTFVLTTELLFWCVSKRFRSNFLKPSIGSLPWYSLMPRFDVVLIKTLANVYLHFDRQSGLTRSKK